MHPISRALSSSTPIQMVRFADHEYYKDPGTYTWKHEDKDRINTAIANALTHLSNAHNYITDNRLNLDIIDNAIKDVYDVLTNDTLLIFPLSNRSRSYGLSAKGACEISISLIHNYTPFYFSKTLIHEAFHIIGGCMEYKNNPTDKRMIDPDITCKDDTMFIGKVIADKANLVDQRVVDVSGDFVNGEEATDSYGNTHFNSIACGRIDGTIIYNLNRKYNFLKCSFSIKEDGDANQHTNIVIEADNAQVYKIKMTKLKEPVIDVEIPINNCSLLKISCANKDGSCSCIISDAIIYN